MALYMGKVKIAGSGSGGGGSYVLPEATSSTLGGVKVGMVDTDDKLGVKLDPTTKQAYVTKTGGSGGTCNYNYSQLSGTVEDIVEGNNTEIGNIVETKLTANNTAIGTVVEGKLTTNNTAIGTVVEGKLTTNNTAIGTVVENKLTANNPTIQGYVTGNNDVLSSSITGSINKKIEDNNTQISSIVKTSIQDNSDIAIKHFKNVFEDCVLSANGYVIFNPYFSYTITFILNGMYIYFSENSYCNCGLFKRGSTIEIVDIPSGSTSPLYIGYCS